MAVVALAVTIATLLLVTLLHETTAERQQYDHGVDLPTTRPLNIAHRGSSGVYPEHTIAAYRQAIADGADVIECDVILTKDLQLVCLHDPYLSAITNVASFPEFADRKRNLTVVDYGYVYDWFSVDFTLKELRMLKVQQRFSERDDSFNWQYNITTLAEFLQEAQAADRPVGVYAEMKDPDLFNAAGILAAGERFEDLFLAELEKFGYTEAEDPCFIQSFSESALLYVADKTDLPLVMLVWEDFDKSRLSVWGEKFYGLGAWKPQVALYHDDEKGYKNWIQGTTTLVEDVHSAGLRIHLYTFRNEDHYLAWDFKQDPELEYQYFVDLGIDGFFSDFPHTFQQYLDRTYGVALCTNGGAISRMSGVLVGIIMTVLGRVFC